MEDNEYIFVINMDVNENDEITRDKTHQETYDAYLDGKKIITCFSNNLQQLIEEQGYYSYFPTNQLMYQEIVNPTGSYSALYTTFLDISTDGLKFVTAQPFYAYTEYLTCDFIDIQDYIMNE